MKNNIAVLLLLVSITTFIFGDNKGATVLHEDKLVPEPSFDRSKTEKELKDILNAIAEQKPDYTIKVVKERHGLFGSNIMYRYHINNIPDDLTSRFRKYTTSVLKHNFKKYVFDERYSFYFILLLLQGGYGPPPEKIQPLIEKNKEIWDNEVKKYGNFLVEYYNIAPSYNGYLMWIFTGSLPGNKHLPDGGWIEGNYSKQLAKTKSMGYHIDGYKRGEKNLNDNNDAELYPIADIIEKAIEEFNSDGKCELFSKIDTNKYGFRPWFYFIFNAPEKDIPYNIKPFIAYLRQQTERKPLHSAIVMSLFIVFGYDFNENTGKYIPNELGKVMLDYIVENPIPENAERLIIIRDGGNEKLIGDLMEKHKTKEKWDELFCQKPSSKGKMK